MDRFGNVISKSNRLLFILPLFLWVVFSPGCNGNGETAREQETWAQSQIDPIEHFAETITIEELKDHIIYLASDKLEGRLTGKSGARLAAQYISDYFESLRLQGIGVDGRSYLQEFRMIKKKPLENFIESENGRVDNWDGFMEMHGDFCGEKDIDLIFAGYGRDVDFEEIDVNEKIAAFFMGNPQADELGNDRERKKIAKAIEKGAVGTMLIVHDSDAFLDYLRKIKPYFNKPRHYQDTDPGEALNKARNNVIATGTRRPSFSG